MKIVCLLGSPRPTGNSTTIAKQFLETAERNGATVRFFSLNHLSYRGCQACMACKTKLDHCILQDDLTDVLEAVRDSDVLVIASPVYYGEVSSQMKGFIDRTFSFLKPDYTTNPEPGRLSGPKQMVCILTQAQPDEQQFADIFPRYDSFFQWYGFRNNRLIRACGVMNTGDVLSRPDILNLAEQTARQLTAG